VDRENPANRISKVAMEEIIMEMQERGEREINLMGLIWQTIFGWRQIICFGVIFAILLSGAKYFKDIQGYKKEKSSVGQEEVVLPDEEMQQVLEARNLMSRIEEYEGYLETSALMQINPYEKPLVELQYYIDSDYTFNYTQENESDYTGNLMALYYNYIVGGEMSKKIIGEAGLSIRQADISELWSISQSGYSFSVKFICPEEKKMEAVAEVIKEQLKKQEQEFQLIGAHELKLLGESENVVVDYGLIDRKNTISNNIATINTQLNNLKTNMTEGQIGLIDSEQTGTTNDLKMAEKPRFSFKYVVLGAFAGIFLACAWIVCKVLFTVRLQSPEEIRTYFNARLLGEISIQPQKKRFLSIVDDRLLALKNRRKKKIILEQQIKILSANIALSCKQQGINHIYMTGSEYEHLDVATLNLLKKELYAQNIQVKEGGNIFYDAESLKQGTEIGNMLFVEQTGQSIYDEISNELNLAKEQNNYILGVVVLV